MLSELASAARGSTDPLATYNVGEYLGEIYSAARRHRVDTRLIYGIFMKESSGLGGPVADHWSFGGTRGPTNIQASVFTRLNRGRTDLDAVVRDKQLAMDTTAKHFAELESKLDMVAADLHVTIVSSPGTCSPPSSSRERVWYCKSTLLTAAYVAGDGRLANGDFFRSAFEDGGFAHGNAEFKPVASGANAVTAYFDDARPAICSRFEC